MSKILKSDKQHVFLLHLIKFLKIVKSKPIRYEREDQIFRRRTKGV
jgi:hypothetical protein